MGTKAVRYELTQQPRWHEDTNLSDVKADSKPHLQNCGVSKQLDFKELRDAADDIAHFVVEQDYHLLFVGRTFGSLGLWSMHATWVRKIR